jgi:hypothetical protein
LALFTVRDDIAAGRLVPVLERFNPGDYEHSTPSMRAEAVRFHRVVRALLDFPQRAGAWNERSCRIRMVDRRAAELKCVAGMSARDGPSCHGGCECRHSRSARLRTDFVVVCFQCDMQPKKNLVNLLVHEVFDEIVGCARCGRYQHSFPHNSLFEIGQALRT